MAGGATEAKDGYVMLQPGLLCPSALGRPSRRRRRYTLWLRKGHVSLRLPPPYCFRDVFELAFHRSLSLCGGIYLAASATVVRERLHAVLQGMGFEFPDGEELLGEMALTTATAFRLRGYRRLAKEKGLVNEDGEWNVPVAFANLSQNAEARGSIDSGCCPTLLRASTLFDMRTGRELLPQEYWLVQGYPHPDVVESSVTEHYPLSGISLSANQTKQLTGNGMHLACVGAMLCAALAFTRKDGMTTLPP